MIRVFLLPLLLLAQTGCVALADAFEPLQRRFGAPSQDTAAQYHFHWQLSGSPAVAPLQVFDDGRRTWLQFAPGQAVPALFAESAQGDILLQPVAQGAFQVLDGVWPVLVARGGHLQSLMRRQAQPSPGHAPGHDAGREMSMAAPALDGAATRAGSGQGMPDARAMAAVPGTEITANAPGQAAGEALVSAQTNPVPAKTTAPGHPVSAQQQMPVVAAAIAPRPVAMPVLQAAPVRMPAPAPLAPGASGRQEDAPAESRNGAPAEKVFEIHPGDLTMRAALQRWSIQAGWTFAPEHWSVAVDIPVTASARFALPFLQAVQELMASTELAEQPLQPCFYANRVLRIVPYAQSCDRTVQGAAS